MTKYDFEPQTVIALLNRILETELAGVVRYTHYSFMIFGPNRIPIVSWLRQQANESAVHAQEAGELITHLGGHPSLSIGPLLETYQHDTMTILREALTHEETSVELYMQLLTAVKDKSIMIEEFARRLISEEEQHIGDVQKMIGAPSFA